VNVLTRLPRRHLAVYAFYLLIAIVITFPLITALSSRLMGDSSSDAYEMARHIWWFKYALQTGKPLFFQPMLGYPDGISGVSLWADPLQFFPAWLFAFAMPLASAYNITILLTMALNGWAMYLLMIYLLRFSNLTFPRPHAEREWFSAGELGIEVPALFAGLIFMAFPTMQGHLFGGHAGLLVMWPVPLYIYSLSRLIEAPKRHWFILSVVFFVLSPAGHSLQLIYVLLPLNALFALALILRRDWRGAARLALVALIGSAVLLEFLLPVVNDTLETEAYTDQANTVVHYSADLLAIVSPSFLHPLFGRLDYTHRVLGSNLVEGSAYVGIIAAVLAVLAVWRKPGARGWLALAALAWVLSLGPLLKIEDIPVTINAGPYQSYFPLPFAALQNLPFFNLARTPGRFDFALALAVAVLVGYGAEVLWNGLRSGNARQQWLRGSVFMLLAAGSLYEYQAFWDVNQFTVSAAIPDAVSALSQRSDVHAVFDIPWANLLAAKDGLYLQTAHEKPLIAGHVTRQTPVSPAKLNLLEKTLDPKLLKTVGADVVILHKDRLNKDDPLPNWARLQLGKPSYEDDRIAIFDVLPTSEPPGMVALPAANDSYANQADSYVYLPAPGWVDFRAALGSDGREVVLSLDAIPALRWTQKDETTLEVALPVATAGFHTVTLGLRPPCIEAHDPTLTCRALTLRNASIAALPASAGQTAQFDKGIALAAAYVPQEIHAGDKLKLGLWWHFDQPRSDTDIRFVHVFDSAGSKVAQTDDAPGAQSAGSTWADSITFSLPGDLQPGEYVIYTGWYSYPDLARFPVIASTDQALALNGLALVGHFTVSAP
jgi:hypothetical protein